MNTGGHQAGSGVGGGTERRTQSPRRRSYSAGQYTGTLLEARARFLRQTAHERAKGRVTDAVLPGSVQHRRHPQERHHHEHFREAAAAVRGGQRPMSDAREKGRKGHGDGHHEEGPAVSAESGEGRETSPDQFQFPELPTRTISGSPSSSQSRSRSRSGSGRGSVSRRLPTPPPAGVGRTRSLSLHDASPGFHDASPGFPAASASSSPQRLQRGRQVVGQAPSQRS